MNLFQDILSFPRTERFTLTAMAGRFLVACTLVLAAFPGVSAIGYSKSELCAAEPHLQMCHGSTGIAIELLGMFAFFGAAVMISLVAYLAKTDKAFEKEISEATGFDKACEKLDSYLGTCQWDASEGRQPKCE